MNARPNIQVGVPTTGRRDIVDRILPLLKNQTRAPDRVIVAVAEEDDVSVSSLSGLPLNVTVLHCERGSCAQRNRIIENATQADILLFLDDDFLMADDYLARLETLFEGDPSIVMATGILIADGIIGPGLAVEDGLRLLAGDKGSADPGGETYNGYGCNMAVRACMMRDAAARFDERLPLYGWLEDVDFSRQLAGHGRIVRSPLLRGVHLGVKVGRSPGYSFGYSQIANPIYLTRKRTMSAGRAGTQLMRNVLANIWRLHRPEPWVDRRGRVKGNLRAFADLFRGRLSPMRIIELGARR